MRMSPSDVWSVILDARVSVSGESDVCGEISGVWMSVSAESDMCGVAHQACVV